MPYDHVLPGDTIFVTRIEAAERYLRCHRTTIDRHVKDGLLPRYKRGRSTLFLLSDVMKLVVLSPDYSEQRERMRRKSRGSIHPPDLFAAVAIAMSRVLAAHRYIRRSCSGRLSTRAEN